MVATRGDYYKKNYSKSDRSDRRFKAVVRRFHRKHPKIKLSVDDEKNINTQIEFAKNTKSYTWETGEYWKDFIVEPVIKHMLAPREARAILNLFGFLGDNGMSIESVLEAIKHLYFESA